MAKDHSVREGATVPDPLFAEENIFSHLHAAPASPEFISAMQVLTPKRGTFVKHYLETSNGTEAARKAGYAPAFCSQEAYRLLRRADVSAAIDAARTTLAEASIYDIQRAMNEAMAGIRFAIKTGNANALAKLVEHRARLNGLLIERVDMRVELPDVRKAINEAKRRVMERAIQGNLISQGEM